MSIVKKILSNEYTYILDSENANNIHPHINLSDIAGIKLAASEIMLASGVSENEGNQIIKTSPPSTNAVAAVVTADNLSNSPELRLFTSDDPTGNVVNWVPNNVYDSVFSWLNSDTIDKEFRTHLIVGPGVTLSLPSSPIQGDTYLFVNKGGGSATLDGNGENFQDGTNPTTATVTLADGEVAEYKYLSPVWFKIR